MIGEIEEKSDRRCHERASEVAGVEIDVSADEAPLPDIVHRPLGTARNISAVKVDCGGSNFGKAPLRAL